MDTEESRNMAVDTFPFKYVGGGYFRDERVPVNEKAEILHGRAVLLAFFDHIASNANLNELRQDMAAIQAGLRAEFPAVGEVTDVETDIVSAFGTFIEHHKEKERQLTAATKRTETAESDCAVMREALANISGFGRRNGVADMTFDELAGYVNETCEQALATNSGQHLLDRLKKCEEALIELVAQCHQGAVFHGIFENSPSAQKAINDAKIAIET